MTTCPICGTLITTAQHIDIEEDLTFESPRCPVCQQDYAAARAHGEEQKR